LFGNKKKPVAKNPTTASPAAPAYQEVPLPEPLKEQEASHADKSVPSHGPTKEQIKEEQKADGFFLPELTSEKGKESKGKESIRMTSKQKATNPKILRETRQRAHLDQAHYKRLLKQKGNRMKWSSEQVSNSPPPNMPRPAPQK
jgi:hypothetical protein